MAALRGRGSPARDLQASQNCQFVSLQRTQLVRRSLRQLQRRDALVLSVSQPSYGEGPQQPLQPGSSADSSSSKQPDKDRPLVRVQLSVHYRVHSRQVSARCGGAP